MRLKLTQVNNTFQAAADRTTSKVCKYLREHLGGAKANSRKETTHAISFINFLCSRNITSKPHLFLREDFFRGWVK